MDLLAPTGLALGILAIPLAALYFLRIRRKRVRVSSLMPWQAAQQSDSIATPFHRFRRRLLLWIQLAVLALLTLALARPALNVSSEGTRSVMLIIDNTASMGSTDIQPSRLHEAKEQAQELLEGPGFADEFMLVEASARTQVHVGMTRDRATVRQAIDNLVPSQAPGLLDDAQQLIEAIQNSRPGVEVHVFTDQLWAFETEGSGVTLHRIGNRSDNVGITRLDLRRSPINDLQRQVFLTLVNAGPRAAETGLEVFVGDRLIDVQALRMPPGERRDVIINVDGATTGWLNATLDTPGDILAADDQAWAFLEPPGAKQVLLVGDDPLAERLLRADPRVQLRVTGADKISPGWVDEADCVLFAGPLPDERIEKSYAVLGPQERAPVTFGDPVSAPTLLDWRQTHPVMRFVNPSGAMFGQVYPVRDAAGLTPLVRTDKGPLILAGEQNGSRIVQLAFDPYTSDLPLRVAWPVLLMNTVGWLTEADGVEEGRTLQTGQSWTTRLQSDQTQTARLQTPDGPVDLPVEDGRVQTPELTQVGPYTLTLGERRHALAANLVSHRETRTRSGLMSYTEQAAPALQQASTSTLRRELWRHLLWVMLALFTLEWWVFHRRRSA